jgi:hypothetical protein
MTTLEKFAGTQSDLKKVFEVGKKYTIFRINGMAMTSKDQITITRIHDDGNPIFKRGRERKEYILKLESRAYASAPMEPFDGAVFEGWDQPVTCDTDINISGNKIMRGNACFNFVGAKEEIKKWIAQNQLNPWFKFWISLAVGSTPDTSEKEEVVFPEYYRGDHAVIDRILNK